MSDASPLHTAPPALRPGPDLARLALSCLDLTSLGEQDDEHTVRQLCARAQGPAGPVAAVCVWPRGAALARALLPPGVRVAAVVNFPEGTDDIPAALIEAQTLCDGGVQEIDLVLPWRSLIAGDAPRAAALVRAVRRASRGLTLKLILESGELEGPGLLGLACRIGIDEGADLLKTSTGKRSVGATPTAARTMLEALAADAQAAGRLGFKVSGGVRTVAQVAVYAQLVRDILGPQALDPARFRIGASALLDDIEAVLAGSPGASDPSASTDRY